MLNVPTLAKLQAEGKKPDVIFWVGCAGSFDDRAKKITKAFVKILNQTGTSFGVLGPSAYIGLGVVLVFCSLLSLLLLLVLMLFLMLCQMSCQMSCQESYKMLCQESCQL